jgi:hypothetical protein
VGLVALCFIYTWRDYNWSVSSISERSLSATIENVGPTSTYNQSTAKPLRLQ